MPAPLAIPLIGKLGLALKGLGAGKAAAAGATAAKGGGLRMAGDALKNTGKFFLNNLGSNKVEVMGRIAPDIFFGGMAGLQTPGDLGDKLIAGGTQMVGGLAGGVGAAGLAKKFGAGGTTQFLADMGGSVAGDYAGMYTGDALMRAKGGGMTPWERLQAEGNEQMKEELTQQILQQYGLAGHRPFDPFLVDNGLGA